MIKVNRKAIIELMYGLKDDSTIFSTRFKKKDGSVRDMVCRLGVKKGLTGKGMRYNPKDKHLLPVYEMTNDEERENDKRRMINLDTVEKIKMHGQEYIVV